MRLAVSEQALAFLYSGLFGAIVATLYDLVRLIRASLGRKKVAEMCLDAVFVLISCLMLLGFVLTVLNGQMRWYGLLGIGLGWMLYAYLLSPTVFAILTVFSRILVRSLRFTGDLIRRIFGGIYHFMQRIRKRILDGHRKKKAQRSEKKPDQT